MKQSYTRKTLTTCAWLYDEKHLNSSGKIGMVAFKKNGPTYGRTRGRDGDDINTSTSETYKKSFHKPIRQYTFALTVHEPWLTRYHTMPHFDALMRYSCGKHCEKRRNCLEQAISPFLTMFSTLYGTYFSF